MVLSAVAVLAHHFDGGPSDATYAANIMLFKPSSSLTSPQEITEFEQRLVFTEEAVDIRKLLGVLDLRCELSTTNRVDGQKPDAQLKPLALPIPHATTTASGRSYVLPGAPAAFCERKLNVYADTQTLSEWCKRNGAFSPVVIDKVAAYFQSGIGREFRSFASLPLMWSDDQPVGVLNIHSSQVGMLRSSEDRGARQGGERNEPIKQFVAATAAFRSMLLFLLDLLEECECGGRSSSQPTVRE